VPTRASVRQVLRLRLRGTKLSPRRSRVLRVGLLDEAGNITTTLTFDGRDAWALDQLIQASTAGCTPIDNPAPRWSHYIWKIRRVGIVVETHDEPHGGAYAGHHARYELRSRLAVIERTFTRGAALCSKEPQILRPFHRSEAITVAEAAVLSDRSLRTTRDWCLLHDIGRRIGGRWAVSRVALTMWLDGDKDALARYLYGDCSSPAVTAYFHRLGVPLPRQPLDFREQRLSEANEGSRP
jgi:hypothetical protein